MRRILPLSQSTVMAYKISRMFRICKSTPMNHAAPPNGSRDSKCLGQGRPRWRMLLADVKSAAVIRFIIWGENETEWRKTLAMDGWFWMLLISLWHFRDKALTIYSKRYNTLKYPNQQSSPEESIHCARPTSDFPMLSMQRDAAKGLKLGLSIVESLNVLVAQCVN